MKKYVFLILSVMMLMTSCSDKTQEKVKAFAVDFAQKASKNQVDSIRAIYPEAAKIDSFALTFNADSVVLTETEKPGIFKVSFTKDADMLVESTEDGKITVKEIRGLAAFPEETMSMALATGWITADLNDLQRQQNLSDTGFVEFYNKYIEKKISEMIVLKNPHGELNPVKPFEGIIAANEKHVAQLVVINKSDKPIEATAYTVYYETFIGNKFISLIPDGDPEYHTFYSDRKQLQGKQINPNGEVKFTITDYNFVGGTMYQGMSYEAKLKINFSDPSVKTLYKPTGKEYEEYLATK